MRRLILSCAVAIASASAAAPAQQAMIVYDTALGPGWQNWSWATTELSVELNGSARRPIRVEAGPWQALYLHHDPFSAASYKKLSFLIQGSPPGGQQVKIFLVAGGKPLGQGKPMTLSASGWTKVEAALPKIAPGDPPLDGIWIQNATDQVLPHFYVTEIALN